MPDSRQSFPIAFAARDVYPWSAVIVCHDTSIASGGVVAPRWVLTCAHVPVRQFDQVMIGGCDLSLRDGQFCIVERVVRNPDYNPETHEADLALLRLYDAPDVKPLAIARHSPVDAKRAELIGWGQAAVGDPAPGDLRQIVLTADSKLKVDLNTIIAGVTNAVFFPPTHDHGRVSYGDSGAPLLVDNEAVALMSFRIKSGTEDASIPLPRYRQWIEDTISER